MARTRKMLQLAKTVSDSFTASVFEKFSIVLTEKTFFFLTGLKVDALQLCLF